MVFRLRGEFSFYDPLLGLSRSSLHRHRPPGLLLPPLARPRESTGGSKASLVLEQLTVPQGAEIWPVEEERVLGQGARKPLHLRLVWSPSQ